MSQTPNQQAMANVLCERSGNVMVIKIDNPPVNALNADVRRGLSEAIYQVQSDPQVDAVLIVGNGRNFIGGADIREFGQTRKPPLLPDVCDDIESSKKLVVVAIHGAALGGGLEVALAAHYRMAMPNAKLGLPEVTLGLMPGAGGTQRTPRLVGMTAALDLMLSGRSVDAYQALTLGLIDRMGSSEDALAEGLAWTRELLSQGKGPRRTRDATSALAELNVEQTAIDKARLEVQKKQRGLFSPMRIIEAASAALEQSFDDALRLERQLFAQCLESPQRAGLIHAFFAEREVAKDPAIKDSVPRPISRVGVVGGGTMGAGIAVALLDAGIHVTMVERDEQSLKRGRSRVEKVYEALVGKGRLDASKMYATLQRFTCTTSFEAFAKVNLVIEAIFEDMTAKKAVFAELGRVCKPGTVLATNTSYLDIEEMATEVPFPSNVLGLHFFSPANVMKLLEIVVPKSVDSEVVATAFDLAKRMKKIPVRAGICDGFIGNRILAVYRQVADYMVEDGASPYQVDRVMRDFGYPMGPFQVADLAGGDIGWATRKRRAATRDPKIRYVHISDRLCERGWFGQKTERGYYLYPDGVRVGQEDPEVLTIITEERQKAGVTPRSFTDEEILRRYLAAMINEGANVVHERIALRPLDVDVVMLHGYGFPRHRGGPMKYADGIGLSQVLQDIRLFAKEDPLFWVPSPLLVELSERGAAFDDLNRI